MLAPSMRLRRSEVQVAAQRRTRWVWGWRIVRSFRAARVGRQQVLLEGGAPRLVSGHVVCRRLRCVHIPIGGRNDETRGQERMGLAAGAGGEGSVGNEHQVPGGPRHRRPKRWWPIPVACCAATGKWEYPGPSVSKARYWSRTQRPVRGSVFEQTDSHSRPGAGLLLDTELIRVSGPAIPCSSPKPSSPGRSRIQWLLDGATSFAPHNSFALASPNAAVRAFGAHESDGVWAIYAGVGPTGILAGNLVTDQPHPGRSTRRPS